MRVMLVLAALVMGPGAYAQTVSPLNPPSSAAATAAQAKADQAYTLASQACVATPAVPSAEMVGGAAGTANGQCRPVDSVQPRITRATTCTLSASGTCTVTWSTPLSAAPTVIMSPINTGTMPVSCNVTAAPTTTSASIKCWTAQTVTVSILGAVVAPFTTAASGVSVQVIAIPPTQ